MIGRVSDIDLRLLRMYVSVVEAGGFSLATAKLNVAESTVSQHMSDLERRLGMRLCDRGRSGFRLTVNGERVYKATIELLNDLDRYRNQLAVLNAQLGGTVRVGLPDAIVTARDIGIVEAIQHFIDDNPDVAVEIEVSTPRDLERRTLDGHLRVAVSPEHRRVAGLDYAPIFAEPNLLYCGRRHPLFGTPDAEIADADLEASPRIARGYLDRFDGELFDTANYRASVQQIEAAAILILTGRLIGFLPAHYAAGWVARNDMRALRPERFRFDSTLCLIRRREAVDDPHAIALWKAIGACRGLGSGDHPGATAA